MSLACASAGKTLEAAQVMHDNAMCAARCNLELMIALPRVAFMPDAH